VADKGQPEIGDLTPPIKWFERHLRATNRPHHREVRHGGHPAGSPPAIRGPAIDVAQIRRRDVEAYIAHLLGRYKPGTALTR